MKFKLVLLMIALAMVLGLVSGQSTSFCANDTTVYLPLLLRPQPTPTPTRTLPPTPTRTPAPTSTPTSSDYATRVVQLVNQERARAGCAPLAIHSALMRAALEHSTDMALNDFLSHTGSDGSQPWDRMTRAGYNWSQAAENIAAGYSSPESVVQGWMGSPGHRNNILNCSLRDTGVGYYYLAQDTGTVNYHHYWTQVFGTPR